MENLAISKLPDGTIELNYNQDEKISYLQNLTNVSVTHTSNPDEIFINYEFGGPLRIPFINLISINGEPTPEFINQASKALATEVFSFCRSGSKSEPGTDSNLPTGTQSQIIGFDSSGNPIATIITPDLLSNLGPNPFSNGILTYEYSSSGRKLIWINTSNDIQSGSIPKYSDSGRLKTSTPVDDDDAVNKKFLTDNLANKLDEVPGLGLSSNDFTDEDVKKLRDLLNNEELSNIIDSKIDKFEDRGLSEANFTKEEKIKLATLTNFEPTTILSTLNNKVDKFEDRGLSEANFTKEEKIKLAILTNFNPDSLLQELDNKIDEQPGMGLSQTSFTQAEKNKLASIVEHYAGRFNSLDELEQIVGNRGSYAYVSINGAPTVIYAWNSVISKWESSTASASEELPETIKTKYESLPDTNAFTDLRKDKLDSIATGATKNSSDSYLLDAKNHTGLRSISSIESLPLIINAINSTNDAQTTAINSHNNNVNNPHKVTKAQIGLDKVDNTADINKELSIFAIQALAGKEPANANIQQHITNLSNPHKVTKAQIGLDKADNTADLDKQISNPTKIYVDSTKEEKFLKGSIIQGDNVALTGNLTNRLVGSGDVIINVKTSGGGNGPVEAPTYFQDYIVVPASTVGFGVSALSSGTFSYNNTYALRSGVCNINKTTANGSGGNSMLFNSLSTCVISGDEEYLTSIRPFQLNALLTTIRCGFLDHNVSTGVPKNCIYIEYQSISNNFTAKTVFNGLTTSMPLGNTFNPNNWYTIRILVNNKASSVLFEIYNDTRKLITSNSITSNIPYTYAGGTTTLLSPGLIAWGASGASGTICNLDYQFVKLGSYSNR